MTQAEKKRFIRELTKSVAAEVLAKVPKMPEQWDGVELRQLVADRFNDCTHPRILSGKRQSDYESAVVDRNL
jgi:hypothetical protein